MLTDQLPIDDSFKPTRWSFQKFLARAEAQSSFLFSMVEPSTSWEFFLNKLRCSELKRLCRERGLKVTGRKDQLVSSEVFLCQVKVQTLTCTEVSFPFGFVRPVATDTIFWQQWSYIGAEGQVRIRPQPGPYKEAGQHHPRWKTFCWCIHVSIEWVSIISEKLDICILSKKALML